MAAVLLANRALAAGRSTVLAQIVLLLTVLDVLATIGLTIYLMTLDLGYDWWTILLNVLVRCKGMRHGSRAGCGPGFGMSATHACPLLLARRCAKSSTCACPPRNLQLVLPADAHSEDAVLCSGKHGAVDSA